MVGVALVRGGRAKRRRRAYVPKAACRSLCTETHCGGGAKRCHWGYGLKHCTNLTSLVVRRAFDRLVRQNECARQPASIAGRGINHSIKTATSRIQNSEKQQKYKQEWIWIWMIISSLLKICSHKNAKTWKKKKLRQKNCRYLNFEMKDSAPFNANWTINVPHSWQSYQNKIISLVWVQVSFEMHYHFVIEEHLQKCPDLLMQMISVLIHIYFML